MASQKENFLQVINTNRGLIRSLCHVYYPRPEDQQDAFQDITLQLWKSFDSFRGASEISTWIYRVGLNTLLSKVSKEKKAVVTEHFDQEHLQIARAHADGDRELLAMIMQSLKDLDKAIVVLYLEGYRSKEIAGLLKLSPSNVTTRFNRIKAQLKVKFNREPYVSGPL